MKSTLLTMVLFAAALAVCVQNHTVSASSNDKYSGYLFAYFEGRGEGKLQEHLRFAVSGDARYTRARRESGEIK